MATFLSLSSAAEAENGAKTLQSVWLIICLTAWLHVWKIYPDTLRVGLFSHWRAARLGNKSWLAQACDWHAVSGSFGQQKSISLTGRLRTLTHSQTHHSNTHTAAHRQKAASFLDRPRPSAQSPNMCLNLLHFASKVSIRTQSKADGTASYPKAGNFVSWTGHYLKMLFFWQ